MLGVGIRPALIVLLSDIHMSGTLRNRCADAAD
jgi:hypothetical protein